MKQLPATLDADLAVRSYFKDPDWMFKTGIGGVLNAACLLVSVLDVQRFLFVPIGLAFAGLVVGYLLRTARARLDDPAGKLPAWNDWGELFFSGLTWVAIHFGWCILAIIPAATLAVISMYLLAANSTSSMAVALTVGAVGICAFFIFVAWHISVSYLLVNFAKEEKLLAGFAVARVMRNIKRNPKGMLTAWVLAFELQLLAVFIPAITVLGMFIVPSTLFAAQLVSVALLSQAWRNAEESRAA